MEKAVREDIIVICREYGIFVPEEITKEFINEFC